MRLKPSLTSACFRLVLSTEHLTDNRSIEGIHTPTLLLVALLQLIPVVMISNGNHGNHGNHGNYGNHGNLGIYWRVSLLVSVLHIALNEVF